MLHKHLDTATLASNQVAANLIDNYHAASSKVNVTARRPNIFGLKIAVRLSYAKCYLTIVLARY